MKLDFHLDAIHLEKDVNLATFVFDPGHFKSIYEAETGQQIERAITSRIGVALLIGAICAAPSRPAVTATEWLLARQCNGEAFEDEHKKMTGRMIRQIVEHIGGAYVRRGIKINIPSQYGSGAIYRF